MQSIQTGIKKLQSGYDWLVGKAVERVDSWSGRTNEDVQWMEGFKKNARGETQRGTQSTAASMEEPPINEAELEKMSPNSLNALADKANREERLREKAEKHKNRRRSEPTETSGPENDVPESYRDSRFKEFTAQEWFYVQLGKHHVWNKMFVEITNTILTFKHIPDPEGRAVSKINLETYKNVQLSEDQSYISIEQDQNHPEGAVRIKPTEVTQPPDLKHWFNMFSGKLHAVQQQH